MYKNKSAENRSYKCGLPQIVSFNKKKG